MYDAKKALKKIDEVSRRIPREGAISKAEVNRAQGVMEMDSEAVAAVKMVREMAVVNRTAVVYRGALAELMRERGISETEFQRRKQEKECVWCQSKDHFLFACPDYMANGLNQSRAQGQQQGRENYKRELQQRRVLSRADAHRHFRKTGEVAGPHAKANVVASAGVRPIARATLRFRTNVLFRADSAHPQHRQLAAICTPLSARTRGRRKTERGLATECSEATR